MRVIALLLALLVPTLAACSGTEEEAGAAVQSAQDDAYADWRAAVTDELGTDTFDFAAIQQAAASDCLRTDASAWSVELALSGDTSTSTLTRIGLEHACSDVVASFDEGLAAVESATDPLDLVCGPDVELSPEDRLKADLVCANR